jgi:homoserine O-acetyltransferase
MPNPFVWRSVGALGAVFAVAMGPAASAAPDAPGTYPGQREADFVAKGFRFQGGETLPEVRLHYVTLGAPQRDAQGRITNAVLLLHGTSSTSKQWFTPTAAPELFGPGQPLDPARYYVIIPDGLGRGGSTKPSDGLRARFPRYGYGDVVNAQHLLVTQGLGVDHLRAVIGTSMGGMHAWMWAERYPEMIDGAMPIACQPIAISGRNLLFRRILTEAIRNDPDWQQGEYKSPPRHWLYTAPLWPTILDGAIHLQSEGPTRKAAMELYDQLVETARTSWDANDFLYWIESSWDYDPQPELGKIKAKVVAVNFADDIINPAELAIVQELVRGVPGARFVLMPGTDKTQGHRTLGLAAVWKPYLAELLGAEPRAGSR